MESEQAKLQVLMDKAAVNSPYWWNLWTRMCQVKGKMRTTAENYEEIAKRVRSPVIEVGCGFGVLTSYLPASIGYLGVDLSHVAIEQARLMNPYRLFLESDMHTLAEGLPGAFSTAVALQVLEHEINPIGLMISMKSLAMDRAIVTVPRGAATEHQRDVDGHVSEWADEDAFVEHFQSFGKVEFFPGVPHHICAEITWAK